MPRFILGLRGFGVGVRCHPERAKRLRDLSSCASIEIAFHTARNKRGRRQDYFTTPAKGLDAVA
jgi:hypothetical protein